MTAARCLRRTPEAASEGFVEGLEAMYEEVDWVSLKHVPLPGSSRRKIARQVEAVRRVPFQLALSALEEEPANARAELQAWLGPQAACLDQEVGLIEVFTGQAPLSAISERARGLVSVRLSLDFGQDFFRARDRRMLLLLLGYCRAKDVWFSRPCASWSGWSRMKLAKGGKSAETVLQRRQKERIFLRMFEQAWSLQNMLGGHIHAENPVHVVNFHMCAVGMVCHHTNLPVLKPTRVVTSDHGLAAALQSCRCPGHAKHAHLEGRDKTKRAEVYPKKLCWKIARYLRSRDKEVEVAQDVFANSGDKADSERESGPEDAEARADPEEGRRPDYRAMEQKLHVNVGHASIPQMLSLAQRAKAPPA